MTDPWLSRQMAHDAAWVRLDQHLALVTEAALAETLAKLWRVVLDERPAITAAVDPPSLDGLEQVARETWTQALTRWVRPVAFAAYAAQYGSEAPTAGRDRWWADTLARVAETADRLVQAVRAAVAGAPTASVDELRDRVARVLGLDAATRTITERIESVEARLANDALTVGQRADLLSRRVRLQAELFRVQASQARSKAYLALAQAMPAEAGQFRELARMSARGAGGGGALRRELAQVDAQLYRGTGLSAEEESRLRFERAALYAEAEESGETWRNTARRIARTESTNVLNEATLQRGLDAETASGDELVKTWLSSRDERVRETHRVAHGQVQPLAQPFQVGAALLQRPGDPNGPPEEVIQCLTDPDTPIMTPSGYVPVASIRPGDLVMTHMGRARPVVRLAPPRTHTGSIVAIETAVGVLRVTPNHPVLTGEGWVVAGEITSGRVVFAATRVQDFDGLEHASLLCINPYAAEVPAALGHPGHPDDQVGLPCLYHEERPDLLQELDGLVGDDLPAVDLRPVGLPRGLLLVGDTDTGCLPKELDQAHVAVSDEHLAEVVVRPQLPGAGASVDADQALPVNHGGDVGGSNRAERFHSFMVPVPVVHCWTEEVTDLPVYNFAVDEDESYIAEGIAVHNCRCTIAVLTRDEHEEIAAVLAAATLEEPMSETAVEVAARPSDELPIGWRGVIMAMDTDTGDRRSYLSPVTGVLPIREAPRSLLWQPALAAGHDGGVVVGNIAKAWIDGNLVWGQGAFDLESENGREAARLLHRGFLNGVSADLDQIEFEYDPDADFLTVTQWRIMTATMVAQPAFTEARIQPVYASDLDLTLVASLTAAAAEAREAPGVEAGMLVLERADFEPPEFTGPTPLTVTAEGRVFGHLAQWGVCHVGIGNACVVAPHTNTGYAYFHTGSVLLRDGSELAVGKITLGGGHADPNLGFVAAAEHYDNVESIAAYVRATEDEHGIAVAGRITPGLSEDRLMKLRAAPLSGDWRRVGGNLELVAALGVVVPGFPVPRTVAASAHGQQLSLVAAGVVKPRSLEESVATEVRAALRREERARHLAARAGLDLKSRAAAAAARISIKQEA